MYKHRQLNGRTETQEEIEDLEQENVHDEKVMKANHEHPGHSTAPEDDLTSIHIRVFAYMNMYVQTHTNKLTVVLKFRSIQQYHSFVFADFNEEPLMLCETL